MLLTVAGAAGTTELEFVVTKLTSLFNFTFLSEELPLVGVEVLTVVVVMLSSVDTALLSLPERSV